MTPPRELHLELMIGQRIFDPHGKVVGRLEEVLVDERDGECVVREFHVGAYAIFERLIGGPVGRSLLRLLGRRAYSPLVIPWEMLDLSNPRRLRVTRPAAELREMSERGSNPRKAN